MIGSGRMQGHLERLLKLIREVEESLSSGPLLESLVILRADARALRARHEAVRRELGAAFGRLGA